MAEIYYKGNDGAYTKIAAADVGAAETGELDTKVSLTRPTTVLSSGASLRNYTDIGEYYFPSNGIAMSVQDRPNILKAPFKMLVTELDNNYVQQIIQDESLLSTRKVNKANLNETTAWSTTLTNASLPLGIHNGGTGADTGLQACQNLHAASLDFSLTISSESIDNTKDLNDYKTASHAGSYQIRSDRLPDNCPVLQNDGVLYVIFLNNKAVLQFILTPVSTGQIDIFSRAYVERQSVVAWTSWHKHINGAVNGVIPVSDGGTGASTANMAAMYLRVPHLDNTYMKITKDMDLNDCLGASQLTCYDIDIVPTLKNCPTTQVFKLTCNYIADGLQIQTLDTMKDAEHPEIWMRSFYKGTFSPWINFVDRVSLSLGTEIPENADLDEYKTPGTYQCSYDSVAATISNRPTGSAFKLLVHELLNGYIQQVAVSYYGGNVYLRTYEGFSDSWGRWYRTADSDDLDVELSKRASLDVPANVIPGGTDLNGYKTVGNYCQPYASNVWTMVNKPDELMDSFIMYVMRPVIGHFYMQVIIQQTGDHMYMRYFNGDENKWYPWTKYWTSNDTVGGPTSLMYNLFPSHGIGQYIPAFSDNWENGGYFTLQELRNLMGLGNTIGALPVANGGTGAAAAEEAVKSLGAQSVHPGADIAADSDLNDITESGEYFCSKYNRLTIKNCPSVSFNQGFKLLVLNFKEKSGYIQQLVMDLSDGRIYLRQCHNQESKLWTNWQSFAFKSDIPSDRFYNTVDATPTMYDYRGNWTFPAQFEHKLYPISRRHLDFGKTEYYYDDFLYAELIQTNAAITTTSSEQVYLQMNINVYGQSPENVDIEILDAKPKTEFIEGCQPGTSIYPSVQYTDTDFNISTVPYGVKDKTVLGYFIIPPVKITTSTPTIRIGWTCRFKLTV